MHTLRTGRADQTLQVKDANIGMNEQSQAPGIAVKRVPVVSVVVPTRNREALLRETLASVRALEGADVKIELIVVDNGSTDGTPAVAAAFGARFTQAATPGASAARNAGFRIATGDYITFLDDDDIWLPGHLRPHLKMLESRPDLDAAVGQIQLTDFALQPIGDPYPATMPDDGDVFRSFLLTTPQVGATVARMCVRDTVGYFDEALISSEDWDWHLRLALQHRIGFVPAPSILFRQRLMATFDDLHWMRMAYGRRVFVRNLRRAGRGRRPPWASAVRTYLRHRGESYSYFARSAIAHAEAGERSALRRCVWRAIVASPLHATHDLARETDMRRAITSLVFRRDVSAASGDAANQ